MNFGLIIQAAGINTDSWMRWRKKLVKWQIKQFIRFGRCLILVNYWPEMHQKWMFITDRETFVISSLCNIAVGGITQWDRRAGRPENQMKAEMSRKVRSVAALLLWPWVNGGFCWWERGSWTRFLAAPRIRIVHCYTLFLKRCSFTYWQNFRYSNGSHQVVLVTHFPRVTEHIFYSAKLEAKKK